LEFPWFALHELSDLCRIFQVVGKLKAAKAMKTMNDSNCKRRLKSAAGGGAV
jgi:hypothetical protein